MNKLDKDEKKMIEDVIKREKFYMANSLSKKKEKNRRMIYKKVYQELKNDDETKFKNLIESTKDEFEGHPLYEEAYGNLVKSYLKMTEHKKSLEREKTNNAPVGSVFKMCDEGELVNKAFFEISAEAAQIICGNIKAYNEGNLSNKELFLYGIEARTNIKNIRFTLIDWAVKEVHAAEEKYGEKFFVDSFVYDTFINPDAYVSYGVKRPVQTVRSR